MDASRLDATGVLGEHDDVSTEYQDPNAKPPPRKYQVVWPNVIYQSILHLSALYGVYVCFSAAKWMTIAQAFILLWLGILSVTAGAHRLWSHKCYKARLPLKIFLVFFETVSYQGSVLNWVRDHRLHHKYSETDADPHNAKRGFFFAHVGWLMTRKLRDVTEKGKGIDMSDITSDALLRFQHKHCITLMILLCFIAPVLIPMYFWNESFWTANFLNLMRYTACLNVTWLVNSAAHMLGNRPYDRHINASEVKWVSLFAGGEGWHNYHHTFPWDYKASEFGYRINPTTIFIDCMAAIGLAYDLKKVDPEMIKKRVKRTGDGTHEMWGREHSL